MGQLQAYEQASELLEVLTGTRVSDSTIYRMAGHYGQAIEEELYQERPVEQQAGEREAEGQVVYAQLDGSMLFTDDGWQEVKVGRVFQAADVEQDAHGERGYLRENSYRMDYRSYLQQGLMVGSGAIEAAHRTLVQQRMKLSGQRWSDQGANNLLNLRVCQMSGNWPLLIRHIKNKNMAETKS